MSRTYTSHKRRLVTDEETQLILNNKPCPCCGHIKTNADLARELGLSRTTITRVKQGYLR